MARKKVNEFHYLPNLSDILATITYLFIVGAATLSRSFLSINTRLYKYIKE